MHLKSTHIISYLISALIFLFSDVNEKGIQTPELINKLNTEYVAGIPIQLDFTHNDEELFLVCSNSYSTVIINPEKKDDTISFKLPEHIYNKSGIITWQLVLKNTKVKSGEINMVPSVKKTNMESYFGPPSIIAGGEDFAMLVVCPTDGYDNPIIKNTPVTINHQFQKLVVSNTHKIDYLIAWENIFSYSKSGRILTNSICNSVSSKEITAEVFPNNATNFSIFNSQFHEYADGNQITTFYTSVIKDRYGNKVSDGTHVNFSIETSNNTYLNISGNTINGIAEARMIHPDKQSEWKVSAYITGIAESNPITLTFKQLFNNFTIHTSENNRKITVGPLKSFMNQLIPNGFLVRLSIFKEDKLLETKEVLTTEGLASFNLRNNFYPNGSYSFRIDTGGTTKLYPKIILQD